ncbi:lipopolysaccharide biosynthesis protein [Pseudomonas sp.]|uniref:lipopolysaccharide biosynthesis protein n=1 Tax=Pseudomonas sp. TaxID=306 RepID=UPI003A972447
MSAVKKLFRSVATYASANVINSAIPFFLLPVLTRVLSPAEYGVVAMFTTLMSALAAVTGLSLHGAVSVRYFSIDTDHPRFVGTCLSVLAASTSLALLVVWLFSAPLSNGVNLPVAWLLAAVLGSAAQTIINIRLVMWQVEGKALRYGFFQITQTLLNLSLSLYLILVLGLGWEGRGLGIATAVFIFGVLALISLQRGQRITWKLSLDYVRASLRFGIPLIPHSLGGIMLSMSDRFILMSMLGAASTGAYAVGAQIGMLVGVLADAFSKAFVPHLYEELRSADEYSRLRVARQCVAVFVLFLCLAVIYVVLLPYIYPFFVGEGYDDSLAVARLIGFGNAFVGMYYVVAGFIFLSERTGYLSRLTIIVGFVNVGVSVFLVGEVGTLGAAWSYLFVQILFFVGAWYIAYRVYPLPWFSLFSLKKL